VRRLAEGYELRWFTPIIEVELCGHATLAAAHVIWSEGLVSSREPIPFHTKSGILICDRVGEFIELNFPALPVTEAEAPPGVLEALKIQPSFIGRSKFDLFVVESEEIVRTLKPNFNTLRSVPGLRGISISSRSTSPGFDFISRFFAPGAGIDEDPVTGSAHCSLAPLWSERLGKRSMTGYQASRRGGVVRVRLEGDRVVLGGRAVTVMRGNLHC
jgi:predicted PhzF superfamily epimerase YddE/YHI9